MSIAQTLLKSSSNKSSQEMRDILTALSKSTATIEFKLDGTIITANENFLNTVGYSLKEIKGKHHSMFAEPSLAASQEYEDFWKRLNKGEFFAAQYKRVGKGGKEIWIEASYNPVLDKHGKPYKVLNLPQTSQTNALSTQKNPAELTRSSDHKQLLNLT